MQPCRAASNRTITQTPAHIATRLQLHAIPSLRVATIHHRGKQTEFDMHHHLFKATANKDISLGHPAGCPGHLRFHCHVHAQKQHARQYYNSSVGSVAVDTKSMTSVASGTVMREHITFVPRMSFTQRPWARTWSSKTQQNCASRPSAGQSPHTEAQWRELTAICGLG